MSSKQNVNEPLPASGLFASLAAARRDGWHCDCSRIKRDRLGNPRKLWMPFMIKDRPGYDHDLYHGSEWPTLEQARVEGLEMINRIEARKKANS